MPSISRSSPADFDKLRMECHAAAALLQKQGVAATDAATSSDVLKAYVRSSGSFNDKVYPSIIQKNDAIVAELDKIKSVKDVPAEQRGALRGDFYYVGETISKRVKSGKITTPADKKTLTDYQAGLEGESKFVPTWVKMAVAVCLGLGTMIGWKRIVVTVGEKIGKSHLTYGQGAAAELVAMLTIWLADAHGWPVSTTHVLSSGVAGSMAANRSGLQMGTLRNILMAWVLTLPVCIFLGAMFFAAALSVLARVFGLH